jgi:lysophospholipase L1-like esterase
MGDSLSVGMDRHFKSLSTANKVAYSSATKSGTSTFQWVKPSYGLKARLEAFKPTVVLVSLGTNDSKTMLSEPQHLEAIQSLLDIIRASGAEPFWILPPSLPWKESFSELVRSQGVPLFESSQIKIPRGPDKIHPTGVGYAGWAGIVWQSITCGKGKEQLSGPPPFVRIPKPRVRFMNPTIASRKS